MPAELLSRARERCAQHRGPTNGICRECYQAEMEPMLLEQNPGMYRGDAFELVQEWARSAKGPEQSRLCERQAHAHVQAGQVQRPPGRRLLSRKSHPLGTRLSSGGREAPGLRLV